MQNSIIIFIFLVRKYPFCVNLIQKFKRDPPVVCFVLQFHAKKPTLFCFVSQYQGFKNQKSWYTFFRVPNNMFAYTIMHLTFRVTQIVMCAPVYVTYCKDRNILEQKVNLRSIPLTINSEPTLCIQTFLYKKQQTSFRTYHCTIFSSGFWRKRKIKSLASAI